MTMFLVTILQILKKRADECPECVWGQRELKGDGAFSHWNPVISRQTEVIQGDSVCDVTSEVTECESGVCLSWADWAAGLCLNQAEVECSTVWWRPAGKGQRGPQAMDTVGTKSSDIYTLPDPHSLDPIPNIHAHILLISHSFNSLLLRWGRTLQPLFRFYVYATNPSLM